MIPEWFWDQIKLEAKDPKVFKLQSWLAGKFVMGIQAGCHFTCFVLLGSLNDCDILKVRQVY